MTEGSPPPGAGPLVVRGEHSYELAKTPAAALELLRAPSNPAVLSSAEARTATGRDPFIVLEEDGFTLYKPWRSVFTALEGLLTDMEVGPAVTGRLVPSERGSRLEVRVQWYRPPPSQQRRLIGVAVGAAAVFVAMLVAAGPNAVLLGLTTAMLAGSLAGVLSYGWRQRSQDVRDLLAIVERTFGPQELPASQDAPHRRDDSPDRES